MENLGQRFTVDATNSPRDARDAVMKDLWWRDRTLRNHNMYMGPLSAFQDYIPETSVSVRVPNTRNAKRGYDPKSDSFF